MTTEEKFLSPQESLQLITSVITRTKENIKESHFYFLLWGWLITLASFGFYLLHHFSSTTLYFTPFPLLAVAGIIITTVHYRQKKAAGTVTHITSFLSKMWIVLGISFFSVVFISLSQDIAPFTFTMLIAGIGTLVSGMSLKFKPLIFGGIFLFAAAIASIYLTYDNKVLLQGIAIIFGYLIPGYLLKSAKR